MAVDMKSFSPEGSVTPTMNSKRWWLAKPEYLASSVIAIVNTLSTYDSARQAQYQIAGRLYGNVNMFGINGLAYTKTSAVNTALKDRVTFNVISSCIDTLSSKMAKNRPKPMFLTSGGNYKQQRKAKKLDKFVEGVFYENNAYELGKEIFRDGAVSGDGIIHVFAEHGRIKYERVIAAELKVDAIESFYGRPRQLHRVKNIDRDVLVESFPHAKNEIITARNATDSLVGAHQNIADMVSVVESWHLPSGPDANDGLHTITIDNKTLFKEKYEKDFFPFVFFNWSKRLYGIWGQGLAEQLQSIQLEINKILYVIQRSMHLYGTFKIWLKTGSKLPKEHLNNDIGAILVSDDKPEYISTGFIPQEYFSHLQTLKNQAFEQAGISQLSASSKKPSGLDSGRALREFNDIESERFMAVGQQYQQMYMDLAKLSISVAKDIYSEDKKFSVKVPGKKFIETIAWKEVDMEDDEYVMKMFPVSSLPNDPAGRLETIQEYLQAGFLTPRQGRRLLDFPDLEAEESLANASEDWIHDALESIVDEGEYVVPDPLMDLTLANELAIEYYSQGMTMGLEEERLEMLRRFMDQVGILVQKAMPQPPMGAGPGVAPQVPDLGGAQPQAVPQAPPISDMIPNIPQG